MHFIAHSSLDESCPHVCLEDTPCASGATHQHPHSTEDSGFDSRRKRKYTIGIAMNLMPLTKLTNQVAEEVIYSMRKVELKD